MENFIEMPIKPQTGQLKALVDQILYSLLAGSVKRRNLIINDVPVGLPMTTNENIMALILGNLLSDIVTHTENDCIRISAFQNGLLAVISMKNNTITYDKSFVLRMQALQLTAQKMGGVIKIDKNEGHGTIMAVSFDGNTKAA